MLNTLLEAGLVLFADEIDIATTMILNGFTPEEIRCEISRMRADKKRKQREQALKKLRR